MRRARVYRRLDAWVVTLLRVELPLPARVQQPEVYDPLAGGEFWFDEWSDALAWAVRMVGA